MKPRLSTEEWLIRATVVFVVGAVLMVFVALAFTFPNDNRVCVESHVEVTPAGMYFEPRVNTGSGTSIGVGGGIGIGGGSSGSTSFGPVFKSENRVTVCDVWVTPTPEQP